MRTILVLTDFTIRADHAAHYALKLAQKIEANLLLCNVYPDPAVVAASSESFWYSDDYGGFEKDSVADLTELAGRLKQHLEETTGEGFRPAIELCSKTGPLITAINTLVASREILFAVIATHNADDVLAFLNGNHAHEIIENADCPVLMLPYELRFSGFNKIAFATDLTHNGADILQSLYQITKYFDSEVLITHVGKTSLGKPAEDFITRRFIKTEIVGADCPRIQYKSVHNKSAAAGLHWLAKQSDVDLVVLVHRKRNMLQRIFLPSVTKKMADHLVKPMLVFPNSYQRSAGPVL